MHASQEDHIHNIIKQLYDGYFIYLFISKNEGAIKNL